MASGPVFAALLSGNGPTEEKSLERLEDESFTLSVALFHLLKNKQLAQTLREELKQVMPTPTYQAKWSELEKLPYLTPVGQSDYFVHRDPVIFPDPDIFDPDRWIRAGKENVNLKSFLVTFSKGSRQCIGIK
ncbi:hypothetical protein AtubIFM54640_008800 [Aspergillus tubingensis]|nr:hypothetical protein AtubIFM54640_008800 [Aspergillus tubingensis]